MLSAKTMRNPVRQWSPQQSISIFVKQSGSCTSLQRIEQSCSPHDAARGGFDVGKQKSSASISCFTSSNDSPYRFNHHCNIYKMAVTGEEKNVNEEIRKCLIQACKKRDDVGRMESRPSANRVFEYCSVVERSISLSLESMQNDSA